MFPYKKATLFSILKIGVAFVILMSALQEPAADNLRPSFRPACGLLYKLDYELLFLALFHQNLSVLKRVRCDYSLLVGNLFTVNLETALLDRHESFAVAWHKTQLLDEVHHAHAFAFEL